MERRRTAMRKAVAVIGGLLAISQRGAAQAPSTQILRFAPIADTYVDSSAPATSFHASTRLRVNGSPARTSYLRFRVSGVNGRSVEHARLRLGVRNASGETGIKFVLDSERRSGRAEQWRMVGCVLRGRPGKTLSDPRRKARGHQPPRTSATVRLS